MTSKRILVVDDLEENRYLLRTLLAGNGFDVLEAGEGKEALRTARESKPDAVVTDLMMPGMDGFTLCRAWMQDDALWRIPFIVYTATYTDPKDRRFVLELGADDFIIKPAEPDALIAAVQSALLRARPKTIEPPSLDAAEFFEQYSRRLQEKLDRKISQLAETKDVLVDYVTRCEAILDMAQTAVVSIDADHNIRSWSYPAECLFGYTEAEAIGRPLTFIFPQRRHLELGEKLKTAAATKRAVRFETERLHRDGLTLEIAVSISYLGEKIGFVASIADIAEQKKADDEKEKLEKKLAHSQRLESIGLLAGGLAHDFNNLLMVINSHADILARELQENSPLREGAYRIGEAGARAASLTQQLLAFSRRRPMRSEVIDLNKIVTDVHRMLERLIGEDVVLEVDTAEDLGHITGDISQIDQVIMNLAVNARDAMPEGGKLLIETRNVSLSRDDAEASPPLRPGRYVMLRVSDTGCGMDEETRARVFEPFFTTKDRTRGTGLGLATVYGIVQQSRGFIEIDSEPSRGTTFSILFPREEKPLTERRTNAARTLVQGGGETVLVVEDNEMVRDITRQMLERAGYRVLTATEESEVLRLANDMASPIDLLLTDIVMPGMNGYDLAERLRTQRPSLRVVFMSGYAPESVSRPVVWDEKLLFVEKPFTASRLTSVIRDALGSRSPSEP